MVARYLTLLALLLAFRYALLRTAPRLRRFLDAGPWGDALAYFLQIQYYRAHSGSEPDVRCLFRGNTLHTPSWYHRFALTVCSDRLLWSRPWLPNLVLYGLGVAVLLAVAVPLLGDAPGATWLLALVFLAQTDNSRFDERTIHYLTIQPRLLGAMALSLHALLFAVMPSPLLTIGLGALALLVALNTSVFSRQVAYFVLPLAALLTWNAIPLLNLLGATALALLVNRAEFVQSFGAHWRYARWYFRNFYAPREGTGWSYRIRRALAPPVRFLPQYADALLALALLLVVLRRGEDGFAARAAGMIGAALLVCALTSLRKFASLGECWRYISFSCWMLTPVGIVYAVLRLHVPLLPASLAAAAVLLYNLWHSFRSDGQLANPNQEVANLLDNAFRGAAAPPSVWWSAHYRYGSIAVALGRGSSTFEIQGTDLSEEVMATLFARYPYLHCNEAFFDTYRVSHLLISKSEWPVDLYGSMEKLKCLYQVLAENPHFLILARTSG
jgi:hypothetical protein